MLIAMYWSSTVVQQKNLPVSAGDVGLIPGLGKIPWSRKCQPTPVFLPGKSHGQRSLVGYSPWGHKESDTTQHMYAVMNYNVFPKNR